MVLFAFFFAAAIYYRKRPAAHKSLMLLTAVGFAPAALFRISPVPPEFSLLWAFGLPLLAAILCFVWQTAKTRKFNYVFATGLAVLIAMMPLRMVIPFSNAWLSLVALLDQ
jgi:hypothetical protein